MKLNDVVRTYQKCGYKIKKIQDSYFLNQGWINYSFPQLADIKMNKRLINRLKWKHVLSVIKTISPIKNTYEYILNTDEYPIEHFKQNTRTTIRKSLKNCEFKRPSYDDLLNYGLYINRQTLKLQQRRDKYLTNKKRWEKYVALFYNNEDSYILGAYMERKMIGYMITYEFEGKHIVINQYIDRKYSTYNPINGLLYMLVNQIISEKGRVEISDGIESFSPLPFLNKFKRSMLFERVPVTRIYLIHPVIIPIFRLVIFIYIHIFKRRRIKNQWTQKIIQLYQGYRIISKIT